ncbi:hypothetical protein DVK44_12715 [Streptomyces paludis]|uniref:Uncharacterized protein n=1 Tax=Streptomyces paludis TaxID=2282738 RepID=A0A345HP04_9ACTN|nr:hypothetical protein DVK44_12715 [Streptomyces paludis]
MVSVLALTSCSSDKDEHEGWLSVAEAKAEYVAHSKTLTLPPESKWPTETLAMVGSEEPDPEKDGKDYSVRIEPGGGRANADEYWLCTWQRQLLKEGLPKSEQSAAVKEIAKFKEAAVYKNDSDRRDRFDGPFKKAEAGDYDSMIIEFPEQCADRLK